MALIRKNRHALLLGLGLLIFWLLVLINIFRLPLGEADDEPDYMHFARFIVETGHPPRTPEERAEAGARGGFAPLYYQLLAGVIAPFVDEKQPPLRRISSRPERYIAEDGLGRGRILHTLQELPPFEGVVRAWYAARLLSLLLGMGTILVTYLWAKEMFHHAPDQAELALVIALFVAFLPRFVINSATLSDDNLTAFCMILFLVLLLRIARRPETAGLYFGAGAVMGLAFLAKYHGILLGFQALLLFGYLFIRKRLALAALLRRILWFALGFLLIGGPWLVFIFVRFNRIAEFGLLSGLAAALGEPLLVGRLNQGLLRQNSPSEAVLDFSEWLVLLFKSFWFEYGFMTLFGQPWLYWIVGLASLLALAGWFIYVRKRGLKEFPFSFAIILAVFHLGLFGLILLGRYNVAPTVATPQGRHLFPALPVLGVLFFLGLRQIIGRRSLTMLVIFYVCFGLISNVLFVEQIVRPAYPYLSVSTDATRFDIGHPVSAQVTDAISLLGYDAPAHAEPGQSLPLTLYWQAGEEMALDYWRTVCLTRPSGEAVSCEQGYLGGPSYPTRSWEPGDVIADSLHLPLAACLNGGPYRLDLSIAPLNPSERQITLLPQPPFILHLPHLVNLGEAQNHTGQIEIWHQGDLLTEETSLALRDTVTIQTYGISPPAQLRNEGDPPSVWSSTVEPLQLTCPDGQEVWLTPFIVDYGVQPGRYRLDRQGDRDQPALIAATRARTVAPEQAAGQVFEEQLALQLDPAEQTEFYPGQQLPIKTTWQAKKLMTTPYLVSIRLLDKDFNLGGEKDVPLGGRYPNLLWSPQEMLSETYTVHLKRDAPPGRYRLEFSLLEILDAEKFRYLPVQSDDGRTEAHLYPFDIRILDPAHGRSPPNQATAFTLGDTISLTGYSVGVGQDNTLELALYWKSADAPDDDYTVFSQLIGPDGQVWGQQDNPPQAGRYPTQFWRADDLVIDRYQLQLKPGAPPGDYQLLVGMYHLSTGERLPVVDEAGQAVPDRAIFLDQLVFQNGRLRRSGQ